MAISLPPWLALLAPLPADVQPERKPVASPEQIAQGTAGPIAGWQSLSVNLSVPEGLRHVLVTVDESGKLLSGGDHVLLIKAGSRDGVATTLYEHESVGGRFEDDGSFRGTRWHTRTESLSEADDDGGETTAVPSAPSEADIVALRFIVADVLRRG